MPSERPWRAGNATDGARILDFDWLFDRDADEAVIRTIEFREEHLVVAQGHERGVLRSPALLRTTAEKAAFGPLVNFADRTCARATTESSVICILFLFRLLGNERYHSFLSRRKAGRRGLTEPKPEQDGGMILPRPASLRPHPPLPGGSSITRDSTLGKTVAPQALTQRKPRTVNREQSVGQTRRGGCPPQTNPRTRRGKPGVALGYSTV